MIINLIKTAHYSFFTTFMQKIEKYKTIHDFKEATLKEKGSIFTAQVYPVENETDTIKILGQVKKKFYDATHHCFAYKLLDNQLKYSDDGEPNGTAGVRILNAINHFNLHKILVIVIRYFGGTKLGVGPLGKAYYNSAFQVLENSLIIEKTGYKKATITAGLDQINNIYHVIDQFKGKINKSDYTNNIKIECMVSMADAEKFIKNINDISKGKVSIDEDEGIIFF